MDVVPMKKILIIILAVITSLIAAEVIARYVMRYPAQASRKTVAIIPGSGVKSRIFLYKPYSKYLNIEAGYKQFTYNNVGVHGPDVDLSEDSKLIFLAGSSFIEAYQVPSEKTAAAVFDRKLKAVDPGYSVFNLGASGCDPYEAYFRTKLYTQMYRKPDKVILALEQFRTKWLEQYDTPLDFDIPEHFGKEYRLSKAKRVASTICEKSSLASMLYRFAKKVKRLDEIERARETEDGPENEEIQVIPDALKATMRQFQKDYGNDFMLVFFGQDLQATEMLREFCDSEGIRFYSSDSVAVPENRFDEHGHLNEAGNLKLGELFYESFVDAYQE